MSQILIVDDSSFQRRNIKRVLEAEGHEITEATNGREALELLENAEPDYVLLDLLMPDIDGISMLEKLSTKDIKSQLIVITSDVQITTRDRCLELGASMVMNKPPDPTQLCDIVREPVTA